MNTGKPELIRQFCISNQNPKNVEKYARYFKEGFESYGVDQKTFENQRDKWILEWKNEMSHEDYLDLGDELMKHGKYEEKSFAIAFLNSQRTNFTPNTFDRIGNWFAYGIDNWATTDVLCMLVMPGFITDNIISYETLGKWNYAESEWQRRVVPVTLVELCKADQVTPDKVFELITPIMPDKSEYVQKGIGTLLRTLWKKYPDQVEEFLLKWKDTCGRLIVQYATEKMDKEKRKQFKKNKK